MPLRTLVVLVLFSACGPELTADDALESVSQAATVSPLGSYALPITREVGAIDRLALFPPSGNSSPALVRVFTGCVDASCTKWKTADFVGTHFMETSANSPPRVRVVWSSGSPGFDATVDHVAKKYSLFVPEDVPASVSPSPSVKGADRLDFHRAPVPACLGAADCPPVPGCNPTCVGHACGCGWPL